MVFPWWNLCNKQQQVPSSGKVSCSLPFHSKWSSSGTSTASGKKTCHNFRCLCLIWQPKKLTQQKATKILGSSTKRPYKTHHFRRYSSIQKAPLFRWVCFFFHPLGWPGTKGQMRCLVGDSSHPPRQLADDVPDGRWEVNLPMEIVGCLGATIGKYMEIVGKYMEIVGEYVET